MPDPNSPVMTLVGDGYRTDTDISVYFVQSGTANAVPGEQITSEGWTDYEIDRAMAALAAISNYVNITFVRTSDPNADFQLVLDDDEFGGEGNLGFFYQPVFAGDNRDVMGAFNANGYGWDTNGGLEVGGLGYSTLIHEALHGLGLDHPHDGDFVLGGLNPQDPDFPFGDYGDFDLNQGVYTIMSYNDGLFSQGSFVDGNAAGPMALDIARLQEIYGANNNFEAGDNTYVLPDSDGAWISIWDTGGADEIAYSGSRDAVIDLRAATLAYGVGGGGYLSQAGNIQGGYTIAAGVVIENATGGSGNDMLVGNNAVNSLIGNAGSDTLIGGGGSDNLDGGGDNDDLYGGTGGDTIDAGDGNDSVQGNAGGDTIETSSGENTIFGGSGFDDITGGSGADTIYGGSGDDVINGGSNSDKIFGGRGDDQITGGNGNDELVGGLGADELTGGAGADDFVFQFASDSQTGVGNRDTITDFEAGIDDIDISNIPGLSFVGTSVFGGIAGQVRLAESAQDTIVAIDLDGDAAADMEIFIDGATGLSAGDFIL